MFDQLIPRARKALTRRRVITAGVLGTVALTCAIVAPPVVNALRYDLLVADHKSTSGQLAPAQEAASQAQSSFEEVAAEAMPAYDHIEAFLAVVDPELLVDDTTLADLVGARDQIAERAGMHESAYSPGIRMVFAPAPAPRVPYTTSPASVEGLSYAIDRNRRVISDFTAAAEDMTHKTDELREAMDRSGELIERVLASAAKYGTGREILKYTKADVLVKVHLNGVIGDLDDESLDPVARFTAFKSAIAALKKSHADNVAEEERIAKEKKEAEERAAEDARKAEAKAAEEAERLAKEEAERQAQEEQAPRPEVSPAPTHTPEPTPTPTPTPSPEE